MRIMIAYDGSNAGKEALEVGRKHAKAFNAKVDVVTSMVKGTEDQRQGIDDAELSLEYAKSLFDKDGIECETQLLIRGLHAGEDLVRFAQEHKIDEIILGIRRRSRVGKLLMGSTAQYVILEASCPVVTVK